MNHYRRKHKNGSAISFLFHIREKERRKYLLDNLFHIYDAFVRLFMSLLIFKEEIQGIPFKKKDINSK